MKVLQQTQSICPVCLKAVDAFYIDRDGRVLLRKTCGDHGDFESRVSDSVEEYTTWVSHKVINIPPKKALTKGTSDSQCPLHCGTCENHLQTACCVLIDVTKRCNQNCPYCFAKAEMDFDGEPSLDEIGRKYDLLLEIGEERPFNIQLSGGEPTLRDDLPEIIKMGKDKGFEYIQINTNGKRLALEKEYARILKNAGATVIYLQFDGMDDEIYEQLRGEALLEIKKQAVEHCRKAGLPVILVPTIVKNVNLDKIGSLMAYLLENIEVVKGIHFQPVSFFGRFPDGEVMASKEWTDYENRVTLFEIMHELENQTQIGIKVGDFCPITSGHPLCCFYSTYQKQGEELVKCLISEETKAGGISCCETDSPMEIIKRDRDFVLNKWDMGEQEDVVEKNKPACCCETEMMDFDEFLKQMKKNMFTISGMAFQDSTNLDAERLKRCRVQVLSDDDRLIPFCGYNSIYRK